MAVEYEISAPTSAVMEQVGAALARVCPAGMCIYLYGDLGAGKTTLTRGFLRELGYKAAVKSPTYTLVENYDFADKTIYHFDLYRLKDAEELAFMGIREYFRKNSICLLEWPDQGCGMLPAADITCYIERQAEARTVRIIADEKLSAIMQTLKHNYKQD